MRSDAVSNLGLQVVKTLTGNFSGIFVDPSEALLARAEVLMYDDDYDE